VACILVQKRKAAIKEGVKNFLLCLCLLSNSFVRLLERRFSLVTFSFAQPLPCAYVHLDGLHVEVMMQHTLSLCQCLLSVPLLSSFRIVKICD